MEKAHTCIQYSSTINRSISFFPWLNSSKETGFLIIMTQTPGRMLAALLLLLSSPEGVAFVIRIRRPVPAISGIRHGRTSWSVLCPEGAADTSNLLGNRMSQSDSNAYGKDMDQDAMMESDMLVTVDQNDMLIDTFGSTSKKEAHTFNTDQPRGILHRAFSFFLFDQNNKLLLTQRASSKITFPSVWTNTCCSHPLYGMAPDEVDPVPAAYPNFPGIKHAAIRKCQHELGIAPENIEHNNIAFISRFQYWAADTVTYGKDAPWGEHGMFCLSLPCISNQLYFVFF